MNTPDPRTPLDLPLPADDDRSARAASLRSRDAVQSGDRDRWIALFTDDAVVADPVGVSPLDPTGLGHHGPDAIAAFWDTTIGPNQVRMDIYASHAGADQVANVVKVTTTLPDGSAAVIDIVAVYTVSEAGDITSMRAYWEMDQLQFVPAPA